MTLVYFGVRSPRNLGHGFLSTRGNSAGRHREIMAALPWDSVDGALAPFICPDGLVRFGRDGRRRGEEAPEGVAWLHHLNGWTALAYWDRSCDTRGASNSAFLFDATVGWDEAIVRASERYPWVFARQEFEVVRCETPAALTSRASREP